MKGVILAGGRGTRLYPSTIAVSKQLLPVYDKPLIYYPLSVLLLAGIREILVISTPEDTPCFKKLFGNGSRIGVSIEYRVQEKPRGLADAFILGESFIGSGNVCLILGDNVFYGRQLTGILASAKEKAEKGGAEVFGYLVKNPSEFGVVEFDVNNKVISIEEKPKNPKSNYAIPGLYFYDNEVVRIAKSIKPSRRGEIEITDVNKQYLEMGKLGVTLMGRGMAWLDTGTSEGMHKAGQFVKTVQEMQGFYVSCIEEVAWRCGFISAEQLRALGDGLKCTEYGQYITSLAEENII